MKPNVCLYHKADHDGQCSAAIIKYMLSLGGETVTLVPMNYGYTVPWNKLNDAHVYVVDFSLQPFSEMLKLCEVAYRVSWIDHHATVIADYDAYVDRIADGVDSDVSNRFFDVELCSQYAACHLTWLHYLGAPVPRGVELLGKYDIWEHRDSRVQPFEFGLRSMDTSPDNDVLWHDIFISNYDNFINEVIGIGRSVLNYQARIDKSIIGAAGFQIKWEGHTWQVVNAKSDSLIFGDLSGPYIIFYWARDRWCVSLYCNTEDGPNCGALAKKYGGGGHVGAAGFMCQVLPFPSSK